MKTENRLLRNISSNIGGFLLNTIIAFMLSPFVVHTLGDAIFGIWTLVVSLKGYYGLLDLGIRSAVGQYITRYYAQDDIPALNRTMNTALACMGVVAVLIIIASSVVAWGAPQWFNLGIVDLATVRITIVITGLTVALAFPSAVFGISMYATQRIDLQNLVAAIERILTAGLTVFALKAGFGILGLAIVILATSLLTGVVNVMFTFRLLKGVQLSPRYISKAAFKELSQYGIFMAVINIADQIITNLDALVIGIFMTAEYITYYAIGANLIPYYIALVGNAVIALTPYATSLDALGKREQLQALWLKASRWTILFAAFIAGGLLFVGKDFLRLWMGERFVSGELGVSSADVLKILAIAALARLGASPVKQMCFAMRKVKFLATVTIIDALLNLLLSCILVQKFGVIGVAFGTLLPMIVTHGIILPGFIMKTLNVNVADFLLQTPWGGISVLSVMTLMHLGLERYLLVNTWNDFMMKVVIFSSPAVIIGIATGLRSEERNAIVKKIRTYKFW